MMTLDQNLRNQIRKSAVSTRRDRKKKREKLTAEHQEMAAQAFAYGLRVAKRFAKKWRRGQEADFEGAVAMRVVQCITRYDASMGSNLKTWAYRHAKWACQDMLRGNVFVGHTVHHGRENRNPKIYGLEFRHHKDAYFADGIWGNRATGTVERYELAVRAHPGTLESEDAIAYLLRGLTRDERDIMTLYYLHDMTMIEIGKRIGVSESRVCQMHSGAIRRLRERPKYS